MRIEQITAEGLPPFEKLDLSLPPPDRNASGPRLGEVQLITGPNGTGKSRLLSGVAACAGYLKPFQERVGTVRNTSGRLEVRGLPIYVDQATMRQKLERIPKSVDALRKKLGTDSQASLDAIISQWAEQRQRDRLTHINVGEAITTSFSSVAASVLLFARSPSAWLTHSPVTFLQSVSAPNEADRLGFTPDAGHSRDLLQTIANVKAKSLNDFQKHMGRPGAKLSKMEELIGTIEHELSGFFFDDAKEKHVFFRTDAETSSLLVDFGAASEMTFSQAPDGLRSVVGWLVDVIMMTHLLRPESLNPMHEEMVILLDEPETHLHPSWQRKIIPLAQRLLPNAQLLVSTHSPFVVMSVNEGWIHRLEPQADGTVKAAEPMKAMPGDSYTWVMREVMNVPERFDPESEKLLSDFREAKAQAMEGEDAAAERARTVLGKLALRGEELSWIARAELEQMEDELKDPLPE